MESDRHGAFLQVVDAGGPRDQRDRAIGGSRRADPCLHRPRVRWDRRSLHQRHPGIRRPGSQLRNGPHEPRRHFTELHFPDRSGRRHHRGDGDLDYPDDSSCFGPEVPTEEDECSDGVDNDGNGDTDYPADTGCFAVYDQGELSYCDDGKDNDGDIDFPDDFYCSSLDDPWEGAPPKVPALSGPARLLAAAALILAMLWIAQSGPPSKPPA